MDGNGRYYGNSLLLNNEPSYKSGAEIVAKKTFSLYPNPTSSFVRLNIEAVPRVTYRVTVLDVNGRVVHVEAGVNPAQQLDVTKLPKGLYILQLEGGGSKVQQKFIKQ